MAPWDEPSSRNWYASKRELIQMEKEKAIEEMMNRIKDLFPSLEDEEVLEEHTYE
jgi:hypothetical protein